MNEVIIFVVSIFQNFKIKPNVWLYRIGLQRKAKHRIEKRRKEIDSNRKVLKESC